MCYSDDHEKNHPFDHDGVLVNTEHWYYLANKRALAELDIDLPPSTIWELMADLAPRSGPGPDGRSDDQQIDAAPSPA